MYDGGPGCVWTLDLRRGFEGIARGVRVGRGEEVVGAPLSTSCSADIVMRAFGIGVYC